MPGPGSNAANMARAKGLPKAKKGTIGRLMKTVFKDYAGSLIVVAVCIIVSSLASIIATVFLQRLIDDVITPGIELGLDAVWKDMVSIIATMGAIYLLGVVCSFLQGRIMANVTQGTMHTLRVRMFDKMETLPIRYFDTHKRGDIMSTYTNDTDALRELIGRALPQLIQSALQIAAIFTMMLIYSVWLTLVVVFMMFFVTKITKKVGGRSGRYMVAQQKSLAAEEGFVEEIMEGQKVIKVFNREEESKKRFDELNDKLNHDSYEANKNSNILGPIMGNLGHIQYVLIAFAGIMLVHFGIPNLSLSGMGTITAGIIISFLTMSRSVAQTLNQVSQQVATIAMGLAGASRIFDLMDEQPESDDGDVHLVRADVAADGTITEADRSTGKWAWKVPSEDGGFSYVLLRGDVVLEHVDFGYKPEKTVLHDVSLYAKPGQKIAFVGATGAGKTTITNLINRFYDIADGKIRYDGININRICKADLRHSMGIVLQDVNLFTGTVMDNIRYGRLDATDEECIAAAKLANADSFITRLPDGYNTMLTRNGASLSQGQRQLISIARAAVADPPVMILDEATSSIDTRTEALVQDGMDNLMAGRTVFVIAHRLSTIRNSKAIMVLDHGHIIERGDHEQLLAQKGTYWQLYTGAFELD